MDLIAIKNEFLVLIGKLEVGVKAAWGEFCHIVYVVFTTEEQLVMMEVKPLIQQIAIDLQNNQGGLSAKQMLPILLAEAETAIAKLGKDMAYTALTTAVGTVMHDLKVPNDPGNAGNLSGGVQVGG